jgi:hypothetical protein
MSSTQENKAMRDYLDLCKDWFFEVYANNGVEFDEIHEALVHYRQPWVRCVSESLNTIHQPADEYSTAQASSSQR